MIKSTQYHFSRSYELFQLDLDNTRDLILVIYALDETNSTQLITS